MRDSSELKITLGVFLVIGSLMTLGSALQVIDDSPMISNNPYRALLISIICFVAGVPLCGFKYERRAKQRAS